MDTTEQAAWDERYSGPDLVWGAGPNRFAAVAQGGTLLVIGHDRDNLTRGYGGPQDPDRLCTPAMVTAELDGLAVRRATQVLRPVTTPGGERTAIDTLIRAERAA